jgi:hypothetical protein
VFITPETSRGTDVTSPYKLDIQSSYPARPFQSEYTWEVLAECGHRMSGSILLEAEQRSAQTVGNVCPECGKSYTVRVEPSSSDHIPIDMAPKSC